MAIDQYKDIENGVDNGLEELEKPFISTKVVNSEDEESNNRETNDRGSIAMVLMSTSVAVCGSFEFGSCVGYSAPAQSAISDDLSLSLAQYSMFGSILTIGAMMGAVTSGRIADYIGRKGAMRMSAGFCIAGWLAVFISNGSLSLDIGRFFTGFGIGIFSYVVPIFIAEISPKNLRGGLTALNQFMVVSGSSTAYLIGTAISWRALALTGLIPCIALIPGLFFIPESPRWLAKMGRKKEFEAALRKLRGKNTDVSAEAAEIHEYMETLQILPKARILDLVDQKYLRAVTIGVGLMVCQQFIGINGIGFYVSETFVQAGFSSGKIGTICYAIIQIPINIAGAVLMDKSGRKPLIIISAAGISLGSFLTGTAFSLKGQGLALELVPYMAVAGVLVYIASFSIGMGAVPWVIMSEIFPLHIKGVAGSLTVLVNWTGAWFISYTFNFLMTWNSTGTFWIYAVFGILTIIFVARVVPETKGRTLEEIQASINS